jgi:hypothetical protein
MSSRAPTRGKKISVLNIGNVSFIYSVPLAFLKPVVPRNHEALIKSRYDYLLDGFANGAEAWRATSRE